MSFKQTMQAFERKQFIAEGDFLYVESSPGDVVIYAERGQYRLAQGAQVLSTTLNGKLTVENRGEAGVISLVVGFGEYKPPERDSLAISSMPAVELQAGQSLAVSDLPAIELKAGQSVAVSNFTSSLFNSAEFSVNHTFAANPNRQALIIKASASNLNSVLVGSFALEPSEKIELSTTAQITVSGNTPDKIQFIEV
jgi:hypothetical protein